VEAQPTSKKRRVKMIIYVVRSVGGSFEVFSNKKDAEKCKKEEGYGGVNISIDKYIIKTKNELINVMNLQSGGWDQMH
tara:strand:+ start:762 stop:995 length:234 start_codon:yes stop_codon:yes gene_type:complete